MFPLLMGTVLWVSGCLAQTCPSQCIPVTGTPPPWPQCGCLKAADLNAAFASRVPLSNLATNVKTFGAKGDGSTDDTTAVQAAFNALNGGGGQVLFPPGTYKMSAQISYTLTQTGDLSVNGPATLLWTNNSGGLSLTINSPTNATISCYGSSLHVTDLHLETAVAGGGTGLTLTAATSCINSAAAPPSSVSNVFISGDDLATHYWTAGISDHKVSDLNFIGGGVFGVAGNVIDDGLVINGDTGSGQYATVINVIGGVFTLLRNGILYGSYVQGVTINQTNIDEIYGGSMIGLAPGAAGIIDQLTITNNQFGFLNNGCADICLLSGIIDVMVANNLIYEFNSNPGIKISASANGMIVVGNHFGNLGGSGGGPIGIVESGGTAGDQIVVSSNVFNTPVAAVQLNDTNATVTFGPDNIVLGGGTPASGAGASTKFLVTQPSSASATSTGVSCSGSPTGSFAAVGGIVTHC